MTALRIVMCTSLVLWVLGVGHTQDDDSVQCAELNDQQRSTQCALYEYAQLAELAYGWGPANMCTVEDTVAQVGIPNDQILRVLTHLDWYGIAVLDGGHIAAEEVVDLHGHPLDLYEGNDGVTRLACRREEDVRLSISWREFLVRSALYIYFDIKFIAPRDELTGNLEEAEVINLNRIGPSDSPMPGPEQVVAIKGTHFNRVPEVMASANQLLEPSGSCVFSVAATHVAKTAEDLIQGDRGFISNGEWHRVERIAVVGHSLGGTASQYVGAIAANLDGYADRLGSYRDRFYTYSFNGVGLSEQFIGSTRASHHYSHHIDGEFASQWIGEMFRQSQIGQTVRYIPPPPPSSWPANTILEWINGMATSALPEPWEPFRRHKITVVQNSICDCLNGIGSVQGAPEWHDTEADACAR